MSPNSRSITTASYATSAGKHVPFVKKLAYLDTTLAFNLLLSMADASHTDLDTTIQMGGRVDVDSTPVFHKLDEALLPLIEKRARPAGHVDTLPPVPHRWTPGDAEVGVFKTKYPNKQQRGQMYRQKLAWEKDRRGERRQRREDVGDWVAVALADLEEERDYLAEYGFKGYLPQSIARLEALAAGRTA